VNEAEFRQLVSGEKRGFVAALARLVLCGLSVLYGLAVRARNKAFDWGVKKTHDAPVPVVSVGNITTGGTGKTPFVAFLGSWFTERGCRVAFVSRGYRTLDDETNDEHRVLSQLCPEIPHVQNPDRVAAARAACADHQAEMLVLDDGFQHRRLSRDLDIVLVDALNPWGYDHLLPRGFLRESVSSLNRADLIVLTRAEQCHPTAKERILDRIRGIAPHIACVEIAYPPSRLRNSAGETAPLESIAGASVFAFCGIGNPAGFERTLRDQSIQLAELQPFPDHHHYSDRELEDLGDRARVYGARAILTTQKDLVKIERDTIGDLPLWSVEIGVKILKGESVLEERLAALLQQ
jgi:tetraacyldisaccharide 4'-kinase